MKRRILIALLAVGTVGGYASGFAHLHHMHGMRGHCAAFHQAAAGYGCNDGPRDFRTRDDGPGARDVRGGDDRVRGDNANAAPVEAPKAP